MISNSSTRIFYGWWLVLVCLLIQGSVTGVSIYSYSIFAGEVESAFSASRAVVMLGMTGQSIMIALASPVLGHFLDRTPVKWIIIVTAQIMGLGFLMISLIPSVWGFVVAYGTFVSLGLASMGMLSSSVLLSRWFHRYRGLAIGLAALGTQLGGLTIPPLLAHLVDTFDWRITARLTGLSIAVVIPLIAYWTIVDRPSIRGLHPDGDRKPLDAGPLREGVTAPQGPWGKQILLSRNFWIASLGVAVLSATLTTVLANLSLLATDLGSSREQAAWLISLFAAVGLVFSPIIGRLCDLLDTRWVLAGMLLLGMAAALSYSLAQDYSGLVLATGIVAINAGGLTPLWSALIGDLFELRLYARVMGAMALFTGATGSLAPVAAGWIFDATGNYHNMFSALIVLICIPLLCLPLIRRDTPGTDATPLTNTTGDLS
ncbi:MFS transporter [Haliea atlantica]